jgi:hypothetical protein
MSLGLQRITARGPFALIPDNCQNIILRNRTGQVSPRAKDCRSTSAFVREETTYLGDGQSTVRERAVVDISRCS